MRTMSKVLSGAATVALLTISTAASAQYRSYDRYYDRGDGIDAGDVITGVAVLGGVAAIMSALDRDRGRYGYNYGYRYRGNYISAVNACARAADRYGRGGVRVLDVDRRGNNRFRVRGVIEGGYGGGYGGYGGYGRYDRYGGGYGGYGGGYGGYGRSFACTATDYGRVTDFDFNGRDRW